MTTTPAATTLRLLDPTSDFPRVAELMNANRLFAVDITPALLEQWEQHQAEGLVRRRVLALDHVGLGVGYGEAWRDATCRERLFWLTIAVDPACSGVGVGSRLYEDLLAFARAQGASRLETPVRDDSPAALRFAEQRGFTVDRHLFESRLPVQDFDEGPFAGVVEAVEATGIRFFTLADVGDTPEARRAHHDLMWRTAVDIPGLAERITRARSFADAAADYYDTALYRPAFHFIAADGDQWIGHANLCARGAGDVLYNNGTGVDRAYRGRQVALALKLLAIRYARLQGVSALVTNNDAANAPMLAINRKLGYQPQPGFYQLVREEHA